MAKLLWQNFDTIGQTLVVVNAKNIEQILSPSGQTAASNHLGYLPDCHDRSGDGLDEGLQLVGVRDVDGVKAVGHVLHQLNGLRSALHVQRLGQELVPDEVGRDGVQHRGSLLQLTRGTK